MPREPSSQTPRKAAPSAGARWLGVLFGVAAGAALFVLAAPHVSLWIGRTLSAAPAESAAAPAAASAPIDWTAGEAPAAAAPDAVAPAESAPLTPSPEDALKGRSDVIDEPAAAAPASGHTPESSPR